MRVSFDVAFGSIRIWGDLVAKGEDGEQASRRRRNGMGLLFYSFVFLVSRLLLRIRGFRGGIDDVTEALLLPRRGGRGIL